MALNSLLLYFSTRTQPSNTSASSLSLVTTIRHFFCGFCLHIFCALYGLVLSPLPTQTAPRLGHELPQLSSPAPLISN